MNKDPLSEITFQHCNQVFIAVLSPVYPHQGARVAALSPHLGEASPDGLGGLAGHSVDPPVEEDHHHHRGEEGPDGRVEDVARVTGQDALGPADLLQYPATVGF